MTRLKRWLWRPVDSSNLALFRIVFGATMVWEVGRYVYFDRITRYYVRPDYTFGYQGFEWVVPLPTPWIYLFYGLTALVSVLVTVGLFYRVASVLAFLSYSYWFLLDNTYYLNHFYLVVLISFLMMFVPLARTWSLDAWRARWRAKHRVRHTQEGQVSESAQTTSETTPITTPWWVLLLFRFQLGVPYFYGGLAKFTADWLQGDPMRDRLARRTDFPIVGQFFDAEWMVMMYSYGGLLLDLLAVPLLLWKRTRLVTYVALYVFHLSNATMFGIGIFPWVMIAATLIFYPPDLPKRLIQRFRDAPLAFELPALMLGALLGWLSIESLEAFSLVPMAVSILAGVVIAWSLDQVIREFWVKASNRGLEHPPATSTTSVKTIPAPTPTKPPAWRTSVVITSLTVWMLSQCLIPLRHHTYPSNVNWSEHGHRFSWRMMLRDKDGELVFNLSDSRGRELTLDRSFILENDLLTRRQFDEMSTRPYMIHQYAHELVSMFERSGYENVSIHALTNISLNGRPSQWLIDPTVDLAAQPQRFNVPVGVYPLEP
ncbi:MAG: HTTM domain-containing protein [Deinococcota bacterium]